jgi:pimeloyl-ACP methyl ester carboxylesterase
VPGPAFVLVHGIGMSHRYFDRLQGELLDHGDVAVFDLPGFGGTPRPSRRLGVADYAHLMGQALEQARLSSCVLVGHSMGAQFVTELALQRPDLVSTVVLIGPVTDTAHPSAVRNAVALAVDSLLETPSTNLLVAGAYLRCGIRWYLTELPVMLGYRLDDRLARVVQPVLILRGTIDPISGRAWCGRLGRAARRAMVVEVPGQPHGAHRGAAPRVAREIMRFLDRYSSAAVPEDHRHAPETELRG